MNADALAEWKLDKEIGDRRTARQIAAIYNAAPRKKGAKWLSEDDFMPEKRTKQAVGKSAEEMLAAIQWRHAAIHAQAKLNKQNGS